VKQQEYDQHLRMRPDRRTALSMRWLIGAARRRAEKSMSERLAGELLDAVRGRLRVIAYEDLTVEQPKPAALQRLVARQE